MSAGRVNIVVTLLVLATMVWVLVELHRNRHPTAQELAEALRGDRVNLSITNSWADMHTLTNSWVSNGETITVSTAQREGESKEDFTARHDAMVEERKLKYPPG